MPPKMPLHFSLLYMASLRAVLKSGEMPPCHYLTNAGSLAPFSVSVPVELNFVKSDPYRGKVLEGTIAVDRYLPGRCRWELVTGLYWRILRNRPGNLDAAELGYAAIVIGKKTKTVSFAFWDSDNPLPREPPPNIVY